MGDIVKHTIFITIVLSILASIFGCKNENPIVVAQVSEYKWEYVYGDTSKMLITSVNISDHDIKMSWYSFGEHNVAGYDIKYAREQYYQLLGTVNAHAGTTTDTGRVFFRQNIRKSRQC